MNKIWLYAGIIVVFFFSVIWKQHAVLHERNQVVLSAVSEWEEKGKPVILYEIKKENIPVYIKITVWKTSDRILEGYVSQDVRGQLKIGQEVILDIKKKKLKGSIATIADEIFLDKGMYKIQASFEESLDIEGWIIVYVRINTLNDAICIPSEIVNKEKDKFFVWKIQDGKSVRQDIAFGDRGSYGIEIAQGLSEGDLIVIEGASILGDGDKVNILKKVSAQEINND